MNKYFDAISLAIDGREFLKKKILRSNIYYYY